MKRISPEWTIIPDEDGKSYRVYMGDSKPLEVDEVNITEDKFSEYSRCQHIISDFRER